MAYFQLQYIKPQTLAAALTDSPAGLAAWIGEKFWRWTDNRGRIEDALPMDAFLANLTVYWITGTIGSSMRSYYESARAGGAWGVPAVPVGYLMPTRDMFPTPREWIERQGPVAHWTETESGGHFLDWEEPEAVAEDLIRHPPLKPQAAEPPIGEVEVHLVGQPPFRLDRDQVAHRQHANHQLGTD